MPQKIEAELGLQLHLQCYLCKTIEVELRYWKKMCGAQDRDHVLSEPPYEQP
jgi:hypothetical protein